MTQLEMPGLHVGPMGAWLSAVGMLRALHRADPDTTLRWAGNTPVLASGVDPVEEIADRMVFSPAVTPWQSGGGWGEKDKTPAGRLDQLRQSTSPRLAALRDTILAADQVLTRVAGTDKLRTVRELRNWLPELALPWLDVAAVLRDDLPAGQVILVGRSPLTGTGGNDGRWDLSTNYHAAVLTLSTDSATAPRRSRRQLVDLLSGAQEEPLVEMSGGPYWPQLDTDDKPLLNPWAMVLTTEGLLAFGDHPARAVHEQDQPWTSSMMAEPAAPDELGWGEAWLPLWAQPATLPEVQVLLGGPWPRWRGRQARRPADMYGALATGGFPRGVAGFARYGLARRRGRNHQAVLLDTVGPEPPQPVVYLTAAEAAERAGVAPDTWTSYVSRGQAPQHDSRDHATGQRLWWEGTVDRHLATRPGRGARTDRDAEPTDGYWVGVDELRETLASESFRQEDIQRRND